MEELTREALVAWADETIAGLSDCASKESRRVYAWSRLGSLLGVDPILIEIEWHEDNLEIQLPMRPYYVELLQDIGKALQVIHLEIERIALEDPFEDLDARLSKLRGED